MNERFTDRARKVLAMANQKARELNHHGIGTDHLLFALLQEGSGVGVVVLKNLIDIERLRPLLMKALQTREESATADWMGQSPRVKKVIELALEESRQFNHNYVGTEHILLGLVKEEKGTMAQALLELGVTLEKARREVTKLVGKKDHLRSRIAGAVPFEVGTGERPIQIKIISCPETQAEKEIGDFLAEVDPVKEWPPKIELRPPMPGKDFFSIKAVIWYRDRE